MQANDFGPVSEGDVEKYYQDKTEIGNIRGYCDLVLRKRNNPDDIFIIDIKQSRNKYLSQVKEGRAIQLACYSRVADTEWPPTGFFVLETGDLFTCHGPDVIKEAFHLKAPRDEKQTWEVFQQEVKKVRRDLEAGIINFGDEWKDDPEFQPAECKYCEFGDFCGIGNNPHPP